MDAGSGWHVLAPEKWQVKRMHAPLLHTSVIAYDGLVHHRCRVEALGTYQ